MTAIPLPLQYFEALIPGEKNVLTFNFSAGLASGNTLTGTPTVTVSTYIGSDPNPTGILNGSAAIDATGTLIIIPVAVTLNNQQYLITVECDTGNPDITLGLPAVLPVSSGG